MSLEDWEMINRTTLKDEPIDAGLSTLHLRGLHGYETLVQRSLLAKHVRHKYVMSWVIANKHWLGAKSDVNYWLRDDEHDEIVALYAYFINITCEWHDLCAGWVA